MKKVKMLISVVIAIAIIGCNPTEEKEVKETEYLDIADDDTDYDHVQENANEISVDGDTLTIDTVTVNNAVEDNNKTEDNAGKEPVMVENEDGSVKKISDEELTKKEEKPKDAVTKKIHVKKFYVIAGSFKNIKNATNLRKFFRGKGYPAMILYPYHGYNRVATGSYMTRAAAEKDIKQFRKINLTYEKEKIEYWLLWR